MLLTEAEEPIQKYSLEIAIYITTLEVFLWTIQELSFNTIQMENEIKDIIYRKAEHILRSQLWRKKSDNTNIASQECFIHL